MICLFSSLLQVYGSPFARYESNEDFLLFSLELFSNFFSHTKRRGQGVQKISCPSISDRAHCITATWKARARPRNSPSLHGYMPKQSIRGIALCMASTFLCLKPHPEALGVFALPPTCMCACSCRLRGLRT